MGTTKAVGNNTTNPKLKVRKSGAVAKAVLASMVLGEGSTEEVVKKVRSDRSKTPHGLVLP